MSSPWKKVAYLAVGGLTEVGFAAGSLLLVVSHQGRGVVDLASGELLARDRRETGAWFDAARTAALGIGPLDGAWIGVCGLAGGQLPRATADGWHAGISGDHVTVSAPGRQPLLVSESEEIRAVGFSPDGTTFIIATSPGLAITVAGTNGNDQPCVAGTRRQELWPPVRQRFTQRHGWACQLTGPTAQIRATRPYRRLRARIDATVGAHHRTQISRFGAASAPFSRGAAETG